MPGNKFVVRVRPAGVFLFFYLRPLFLFIHSVFLSNFLLLLILFCCCCWILMIVAADFSEWLWHWLVRRIDWWKMKRYGREERAVELQITSMVWFSQVSVAVIFLNCCVDSRLKSCLCIYTAKKNATETNFSRQSANIWW